MATAEVCRSYQEDRAGFGVTVDGRYKVAFVADGHGGDSVAEIIAQRLVEFVSAALSRTPDDPAAALFAAVVALDDAVPREVRRRRPVRGPRDDEGGREKQD